MNETISAAPGTSALLTVRIAPWPPRDLPLNHDIAGLQSRVAGDSLEVSVAPRGDFRSAVAALRSLLSFALSVLPDRSSVSVVQSGTELNRDKLTAALAAWTETEVPVHGIIGFDFASPGDVPGTRSVGLAALVGQEVEAWPADEGQRVACARMVVRLAHDLLINGPVMAQTELPAPDAPRGVVTLVVREGTPPVVEIVF